ncbi:MAG: SpoIIIAH-like family protein, partial [Oscillospiraceae bacterium]|nr:SpoIIIAH-like family protein [Oscillospiraceae bacterium]
MKLWKRNAVIAAVLVFVGAAVYLNWAYEKKSAGELEAQEASLINDVTLLDLEGAQTLEGEVQNGNNKLSDEAKEYFASARLTRQEGRDNALELLQEAAAFSESDMEEAGDYTEVSNQIQTLARYSVVESQIETLVTAKGYSDCVAMMSDEGLTVIVATPDEGLRTEDVARITDIATGESG